MWFNTYAYSSRIKYYVAWIVDEMHQTEGWILVRKFIKAKKHGPKKFQTDIFYNIYIGEITSRCEEIIFY